MRDHPFFGHHFSHWHIPAVGRSLHEHLACCSATPAHVIVRGANASTAACGHIAPGTLARQALTRGWHFCGDFGPIAIQLFSHQLGQTRARALTHFRAGNANHHRVIGFNHHPEVDFVRGQCGVRGLCDGVWRKAQTQGQATANGSRAQQKVSARRIECGGVGHEVFPQACALMSTDS